GLRPSAHHRTAAALAAAQAATAAPMLPGWRMPTTGCWDTVLLQGVGEQVVEGLGDVVDGWWRAVRAAGRAAPRSRAAR
ncbi:hypothetical protein NGM37_13660, partial [Streptomyces sp. TRM76130]|nr:hypothetical protein [Streptomyces sp. TRM76130]